MHDGTEFKLITPTSDTLSRARRAHEAARLAFSSFVGGSLAGLLAAATALLVLLPLDRLVECIQSLAFGAVVGAGVAIGGYARLHLGNGGLLEIVDAGKARSFSITRLEFLATIVACAGIGSIVGLAFNAQIFEKTSVAHCFLAIVGVLIAILFGALSAYAWQVSESRRQAAEPNFPSRETGNPYQPPFS